MINTQGAAVSRKTARRLAVLGFAISVAAFDVPGAGAAAGFGNIGDAATVEIEAPPADVRENTSAAGVLQQSNDPPGAEQQIADFRYGVRKMGGTPRLPVPRPHRVRSGGGVIAAAPTSLKDTQGLDQG